LCIVNRSRNYQQVCVVVKVVAIFDELVKFSKARFRDNRCSSLPCGPGTISKITQHFTIPKFVGASDAQIVLKVGPDALRDLKGITAIPAGELNQKCVAFVVFPKFFTLNLPRVND
jgi:hypothetical protein